MRSTVRAPAPIARRTASWLSAWPTPRPLIVSSTTTSSIQARTPIRMLKLLGRASRRFAHCLGGPARSRPCWPGPRRSRRMRFRGRDGGTPRKLRHQTAEGSGQLVVDAARDRDLDSVGLRWTPWLSGLGNQPMGSRPSRKRVYVARRLKLSRPVPGRTGAPAGAARPTRLPCPTRISAGGLPRMMASVLILTTTSSAPYPHGNAADCVRRRMLDHDPIKAADFVVRTVRPREHLFRLLARQAEVQQIERSSMSPGHSTSPCGPSLTLANTSPLSHAANTLYPPDGRGARTRGRAW